MNTQALNKSLQKLCDKYAVPFDGRLVSGGKFRRKDGTVVRLPPWRWERRYVELKKMIDGKTLEGISTYRFASMHGDESLQEILLREVDLAAWISGARFVSVCAVTNKNKTADVVGRLSDGANVSLECSAALPKGSRPVDKHEMIARRGVGCDRLVDSQVPLASIYEFSSDGEERFTDTDMELYGFSNQEVCLIRSALDLLRHPALAKEWNQAAAVADNVVKGILASGKTFSPVTFQKGAK